MKALFLLPAFVFAMNAVMAGGLVPYFDAVDKSQKPPQEMRVRVKTVQPEMAADENGLRVDDFIVGLNGTRLRCGGELVLLRRLAAEKDGGPVTLHVVRDKKWLDLTLPNTPATWRGFTGSDTSPDTVRKLVAWGVNIETFPTYDKNFATGETYPKPSRELLPKDASEKKGKADLYWEARLKIGTGAQPWHSLANNICRVREAMDSLAKEGGEENRAWVEGLIETMRLLLMADYDAAAKTVAPLLARKTDPFLDEVAKFYAAVARERGNFTHPDDWKKCGVDENFFAICYPWPPMRKRHVPDVFAFFPDLQNCHDMRQRDFKGTANERMRMADRQAGASMKMTEAGVGLFYRGLVAAWQMGPENHDGWPVRASVASTHPHLIVNELNKVWEERPEERNLTAFALFFPAAMLGDEEALRRSVRQIYTLGTQEIKDLLFLVHNALNNASNARREMIIRAWGEEERLAFPRAPVYEHLETRSALLRARGRHGFFVPGGIPGQSLDIFCLASPWIVAEALRRDDSAEILARVLAPVETYATLSRQEAREALGLYARDLNWVADAHAFERLHALFNRAPQDALRGAMITMMRDFWEIDAIPHNGGSRVLHPCAMPWREWLARCDPASFNAAKTAAGRVRGGDSPKKTLETALQNAATPAALVVLARAAAEAGEAELARTFLGMAEEFHREALATGEKSRQATALWGARAFLAEPGHEAFVREMFAAAGGEMARHRFLLEACRAFYAGRHNEASARIAKFHEDAARLKSPEELDFEIPTLIWNNEIVTLDEYAKKLAEAVASAQKAAQPPPLPAW